MNDKSTFLITAHIRHQMVRSPEPPSTELLDALWSRFERSHGAIHKMAVR